MPCTHEINEYKQNRLPLETSFAKFSATSNFLFSLFSLHHIPQYNYIKRQQQKNPRGTTRATTCVSGSCTRAESKNCEFLLFPTVDRRFGTKVKCPTGRASFQVKFPTLRSLTRVKCPGIARGGMGGFGIDWYIMLKLMLQSQVRRGFTRKG